MRKFYVVNVPRFSLCFCGNHSNFTFWSKNMKLPLATLGRLRHALVTKTIEEKQQKEWSQYGQHEGHCPALRRFRCHGEQGPERPAGHWPRNQGPDLCSRRGDGLCDQLRRPGPEGHLQHRHPLRGRAEQRSDPCVFLLRAGKPEGGGREPGLRCDLHQPQCGPPHHLFAALPLPGCGRGDHRQCGFFRSPGAGAGEFRAACGHH